MSSKLNKCPVCKSRMSNIFFDGGSKPLATLGWPLSQTQALEMEQYPLKYFQCMHCTHIWNSEFQYDVIPYENNPNRMFNTGALWQKYIKRISSKLNNFLPKNPTIIDIGRWHI